MASIILSVRLRGELKELMTHIPWAKERSRAQALLCLAAGVSFDQVAEPLRLSRQAVYNRADRFRRREGLNFRARLLDALCWGRPPTALGIISPLIGAVIDQDPRERGHHSTAWTAALLMRHLKWAHGIEVARKSISTAIARLGLRWMRPRHQLVLRPETWRHSKGG